ncbi:MAG: MBL fold metallo-hydrolase [Deferribacteres bacterium]|nr:MBL fold metallo-hydrolase [candidate division KSB1 bacterium]MCB9501184.1 MBL fold metallo-hydrolase [Deferribacteres bacterium]
MQIGSFNISIVPDGQFRLDGGAMFGVVPKALWNKLNPADEHNRILLGLNCLLIEHDDEKILIDTGIGNKFDKKFASIYAIHREKTLLDKLNEKGIDRNDITHVLMSHMHFDHIGWNTLFDGDKLVPTFPNATYFTQKGEFEVANNPDARSRASYLPENWLPLLENKQLAFIHGTSEVLPGIESVVVGGHTAHNSIIKIDTGEGIIVFLGDFIPTPSHLKTAYVMGYDLFPLELMKQKPGFLQQAADEKWLLVFEHAAEPTAGYISKDGNNWVLEKVSLH